MLAISLLQLFLPQSMACPMRVLPKVKYRFVVDSLLSRAE